MTNEQVADLLREMAARRGDDDFAVTDEEHQALTIAAERLTAHEPTVDLDTEHAELVAWARNYDGDIAGAFEDFWKKARAQLNREVPK